VAIIIRLFISNSVYLLVYPLKPVAPLVKKLFLCLKLKIKNKKIKKEENKKRDILLSYGK
jgi:hypothetical protein